MADELTRHPYLLPWPEPDEAEMAVLRAEVGRHGGGLVTVTLHEGRVIRGWEEWRLAVERGLPYRLVDRDEARARLRRLGMAEVIAADVVGEVIAAQRERGLSAREMAWGVCWLRSWRRSGAASAGDGAPGRTAAELAAEAGCGTRLISAAKREIRARRAAGGSAAPRVRAREGTVVSAVALAAQRERIVVLEAERDRLRKERDALYDRLIRYERVPRQ